MGNVPVVHEVVTSVESLGDAIRGDIDSANRRWDKYAKESVLGSTFVGIHHSVHGDHREADKYYKGAGRATGQALLGGGIMNDVPIFQELATAGKSLGDVIGGGDTDAARKRWEDYAEDSAVGSACYAIHEGIHGNHRHANELAKNSARGMIAASVTVAASAAGGAIGGATAKALPVGKVGKVTSKLVKSGVSTGVQKGLKAGIHHGGK